MSGNHEHTVEPLSSRHVVQAAIQQRRQHIQDPAEAERLVAERYLPHRLSVTGGPLDMELASARFGSLTAGLLSYGNAVHMSTAEPTNFHVNVTLRGHAASRSGLAEPTVTTPGQAMIFPPGEPAQIIWTASCRQLCLMVSRRTLEVELEQLLGRSLTEPLTFDPRLRPGLGRLLSPSVALVVDELRTPSGLAHHPALGRHIEALLLDGLILSQPSNYHDLVTKASPAAAKGPIACAAELLEESPSRPWSVVELAQEVHLGVRALQAGFRRDFDLTPMEYLKRVRLRSARAALLASSPALTTVGAVAVSCGFLHMSRFAASYRQAFGESPSETLRRRS